MPMVVAKAMDDNKNLVPLYVAVDGDDFPYDPVTPGFIMTVFKGSYTSEYKGGQIVISTNSKNPTGGNITIPSDNNLCKGGGSASYNGLSIDSIIYNDTNYTINVYLKLDDITGSGNRTLINDFVDNFRISIQPESSSVIHLGTGSYVSFGSGFVTDVRVEIIEITVSML